MKLTKWFLLAGLVIVMFAPMAAFAKGPRFSLNINLSPFPTAVVMPAPVPMYPVVEEHVYFHPYYAPPRRPIIVREYYEHNYYYPLNHYYR